MTAPVLLKDDVALGTKLRTQTWSVGAIRVVVTLNDERATIYTHGDSLSAKQLEKNIDILESIARSLDAWIKRTLGIDMSAAVVRSEAVPRILELFSDRISEEKPRPDGFNIP